VAIGSGEGRWETPAIGSGEGRRGTPAIGSGEGRRGTLALTFDNLGEASELERGTWPPEASLGEHRSVTEALPRLLDELDALGLEATFFVEAINCELYPDALREIAARGHELGLHGWRHEAWAGLPADRERSLIERGGAAFASLGLTARGFRPPGGRLNPQSPQILRSSGLGWCSPQGGTFGVRDGLAYVPFEWELVDAYHLMDRFGELRVSRGDARGPLSARQVEARLRRGLDGGGRRTLILHPFLMLEEDWWASVRRLLAKLATLSSEGALSVWPGATLAAGLRGQR
jgi:peptidoglycan/xylan/chitin deacetylase (PgdA/CDA1 family)